MTDEQTVNYNSIQQIQNDDEKEMQYRRRI